MYIKNNGTQPVEPPWQPTLWVITDGATDSVSDLMWQFTTSGTPAGLSSLLWQSLSVYDGFDPQPVIQPGGVAGWTFIVFRWIRTSG